MDLTNLTLDDLIAQIWSDSNAPQPKKTATAKPTVEPPVQTEPEIYTPVQPENVAVQEEEKADEVEPEDAAEEFTAQPAAPEEQPFYAPDVPESAALPREIEDDDEPEEIIEIVPESVDEDEQPFYIPETPRSLEVLTAKAAELEPERTQEFTVQPIAQEEQSVYIPEIPVDVFEQKEVTAGEKAKSEAAESENSADMHEQAQFYFPKKPKYFVQREKIKPAEFLDEPLPDFLQMPAPPTVKSNDSEQFKIYNNIDIDADVSDLFASTPQKNSKPEPKTEHTKPVAVAKTDTTEQKSDEQDDVSKAKTAVFERPGIITGKNLFEKTGDLSAVPEIITADEMLKKKHFNEQKTFIRTGSIPIVAQPSTHQVRREPDDGQMILPGFGVADEPVEQVDEGVVENELRNRRSKKIESFRINSVEPDGQKMTNEHTDEPGEKAAKKPRRSSAEKTRARLNRQPYEYRKAADKPYVAGYIRHKKLTSIIATVVSGICAVALLVLTAIPPVTQFIDDGTAGFCVTAVISIVLLVLSFGASWPCCSSGISCFFSGRGSANSQTPAVIAVLAAVLQCVLSLIFKSDSATPVFASAAVLVLCVNCAGKWLAFKRISLNFDFLTAMNKNELHTVKTIDSAADANKLGKNVVMGDADIRYSGKTGFISNFLAYSMANDAADDLCSRLVPVVAAAAALIGVIGGIINKNALVGVSVFTAAVCIGTPACATFAANLPLSRANKKLRAGGGMISGYAGAFEYETTNAVAVDAADIFPGSCCVVHGMKTFYGVRIDDAILTAASMAIEGGGPISSLFNSVVMGRKELLMDVEELTYEDRLGLSGWVRGRRVFLGNRKLLENHNVEIPMSVDEAKYRHDGRRVIYLADAGKIAAIFVVSYSADEKIAHYLRKIENSGINLLIRSTDSIVSEEFVANTFGLPLNSVKIVSQNAADVLKAYGDEVSLKADAKLVHGEKFASFLQCISSAGSLCRIAGVVNTQQSFCSAVGLLMLAGLVLLSGIESINAVQVCLCQLLWLGIGAIVPLINRD